MSRIVFACALAGVLSVPAFGQGVDPLIGTWKFNPEKSTATTHYRNAFPSRSSKTGKTCLASSKV